MLERFFQDADFADAAEIRFPAAESESRASLIAEFESAWSPSDSVLISKTYLVPRDNFLTGRTNATREDCLNGNETLIPASEIAPPYIALFVDGKSVADDDYPLVRYVTVRLRINGENIPEREKERLTKKIAAFETALRNIPQSLVQNAPALIWLSAAGDLMLERGSGDILLREGARGILGQTTDYFENSDIGIVNLEGAVSTRGERAAKSFAFRFDPRTVAPLRAAGINGMLLANNHVFDYGETAFFDTLEHLENNGIAAIGAGPSLSAASAPFVFARNGFEVRVFGIASFPRERSGWDGNSIAATETKPGLLFANQTGIDALKERLIESDNVLNVVFFHGGYEWAWRPDAQTRALYEDLARSGADLIVGTHSHTVQGFEWIEGKPFFWSLGNYVFPGMRGTEGGEKGLLIRLGLAGKTLLYRETVPVRLDGPRSDTGDAEQLRRFYARSRELSRSID